MSAWQESRDRTAAGLATAITTAVSAGDKRGVAALLGRAPDAALAADAVTAAVAIAGDAAAVRIAADRLDAWKASCERFKAERDGDVARRQEALIAEQVHVLAGAMGVSRADVEAWHQKRLDQARPKDPRRETAA